MDARAEVLERFGLKNRAAFEINPSKDDTGVWRISVWAKGDPALHMGQGHASRLADTVRQVDPVLAEQLDTALDQARRYALQQS